MYSTATMIRSKVLQVAESGHVAVGNTKKLGDLCMQSIMSNLHTIRQAGRYLAPVHKEMMIQRLAWHDKMTSEYLPHITYNLFSPQLRHINFYKCPQVTDSLLKQLAESRCKLHSLTLHDLSSVTDAGVIAITYGQDEMVTLELRKMTHITSHGLSEVASPELRKVDLRGCGNITADGVRMLISRNRNIENLVLVLCVKVDISVLTYIAQTLKDKLLDLDIGELHTMNDISLKALGEHCPKLKRLNIHGSNRVTHDGVMVLIKRCELLESLDLSYCSNLAVSPGVECILNLPDRLRELSLCGVLLSDEELLVKAVTRLQHLRSVRLCGVTALTDDTLHQILRVQGKQLTMLDLSGSVMSSITDEGLRAIVRYCTKLEILGIRLLKDITGITLLPWLRNEQYAQNVTTLLLGCRKMDQEVLYAAATNCHNLVDLEMAGQSCVDSTLLHLIAENCPHLSHINLKGCRQMTDAGVCSLAYHCPLVYIVLAGIYNLTDKSIFAIANSCPNLEEIYLNGCSQITRQAITYLKDCCLRRVFVEHKVPNANPKQLMAKNLDTGEFCRADLLLNEAS